MDALEDDGIQIDDNGVSEMIEDEDEPKLSAEELYELDLTQRVEAVLGGMSLDDKLCQMFIITPEALTGYNTVTAAGEATRESYDAHPVGGIVYFASNLKNPEQTKEMLANMSEYSVVRTGLPVFLCVDEEGGRVLRIGSNSEYGVEKIGPMIDVETKKEARRDGRIIGAYLAEFGFNVDFAPDADVLTNPSNEVIGNRSFGSDANTVSEYAAAYSNGLHKNNVLSCYKHFPGHGATADDSHEGFVYVDKSLDELMTSELIPFSSAEENGVDMVMVGHIACPQITGDNTPATLSKMMISDILRDRLGFNGLIITDALAMGAVTDSYSSSEAAQKAVEAGVDILLMPDDFESALTGLKTAVEEGEISEERIDTSVKRIIERKLRLADVKISVDR